MQKRRAFLAAALVAVGIAVVPALPAAAVPGPIQGTKSCSASVPYIQIQSTAKGNINHAMGNTTLSHWNNGSTYTTRWTPTTYTSGTWKVFLTGSGGDISYGNAVCYSTS